MAYNIYLSKMVLDPPIKSAVPPHLCYDTDQLRWKCNPTYAYEEVPHFVENRVNARKVTLHMPAMSIPSPSMVKKTKALLR